MSKLLKKINAFLGNEFVFSPHYRVWRHIIYWTFHITIWSVFWIVMGATFSFARILFNMSLWIPVFILFGYPLAYGAIPYLLVKGKVWQFFLIILAWGAVGLYINYAFRTYLYVPLQVAIGFELIPQPGLQPHSYLCMTTSAASPMIIQFFKLWTVKQKEWMQAQQEKIGADLQLLKAQVHPHFLFNTLNSIYIFSLERSHKTPDMILKLSSLLSYMLYDCRTEEVWLEKEIEMMKNYIDLEKERYGDKIEVSWNVEGDIKDQFIAPLMILPFFENAFKYGASEEIQKPWLGIDISVKNQVLRCKIANSKSEFVHHHQNGIGINNVQKRLEMLYPDNHELKMNDEGDFFVVSLLVKLDGAAQIYIPNSALPVISQTVPA